MRERVGRAAVVACQQEVVRLRVVAAPESPGQIMRASEFLTWLNVQDLSRPRCNQAALDRWHATYLGYQRASTKPFFIWTMHTVSLTPVPKLGILATSVKPGQRLTRHSAQRRPGRRCAFAHRCMLKFGCAAEEIHTALLEDQDSPIRCSRDRGRAVRQSERIDNPRHVDTAAYSATSTETTEGGLRGNTQRSKVSHQRTLMRRHIEVGCSQ
ncbi:hypothetical protein [Nocardia sp. NPDC049526]|uniref:hypothetical protein n=1 Tax=Nocardia sp. NPDC049526 TaxID=3364316 RepID=UPI0037B0338C